MVEACPVAEVDGVSTQPAVTVFLCANCARQAQAPTSAGRPRPSIPNFGWTIPVRQVLVPCTGRLQPEHVLKAFESGASLVCTVACVEDNCHYLEGSKRCARRADYIRSILQEVGLGAERLMLFHLPGTATEDMTVAAGRQAPGEATGALELGTIRDAVMERLRGLPPNPLHDVPTAEAALDGLQELDLRDDNSEE